MASSRAIVNPCSPPQFTLTFSNSSDCHHCPVLSKCLLKLVKAVQNFLKGTISGETLWYPTNAGYSGKDGGDEGIRTLDLLSASYTQKAVVIGFQQLTPCTERNNAEESRN